MTDTPEADLLRWQQYAAWLERMLQEALDEVDNLRQQNLALHTWRPFTHHNTQERT